MEIKHNPWSGGNISEFLFYNCPECHVKEKDPDTFLGHALQSHAAARTSLKNTTQADSEIDVNNDKENEVKIELEDSIHFGENTTERNPVGIKRQFEEKVDEDEPVVKKLCIDIKSQCYYCGTVLFGEDANDLTDTMIAHISDKHNMFVTPKMYGKIRDYQCTDCLRMFNSRDSLDIHVCGVVPTSWLGSDQKPQKCPECDEAFEDYGQLLCHFKDNHSSETKYKCYKGQCKNLSLFARRSELSDHVKQKHIHQCKYCYKFIHTEKSLRRHNLTCDGNDLPLYYANECLFCCMRFDTKHSLEQHKETIHGNVIETLKYRCFFCDFVTTTKWFLKKHKKLHHITKCHICLKQFKCPDSLKRHLNTVHAKEKTILCEQCDFRCCLIQNLEKHKRRVHNKELHHFCETCNKGFFSRNDLTNHINSVHDENTEKVIKCTKCERSFKTPKAKQDHVRTTHENFAICTRCEKMFSGFNYLRDHLKNEHQGYQVKQDLWLCHNCDKRFELTKDLNEHLCQEHSMIKDHFCSKCNDAFVSKAVLANHMYEIHNFDPMKETGDCLPIKLEPTKIIKDSVNKQFKCEQCNVYFKSIRTLSEHTKQVHEKESHTHFCTECDWSTFTASRLKKHFWKHSEKQWKCEQCKSMFPKQHLLTTHIRKMHDKAFHASCSECGQKFRNKKILAKHCLNEHQILMTLKQNSQEILRNPKI